jgi:hypothetical protein
MLGFIIALTGAIAGVLRYVMRGLEHKIGDVVKESTSQIQPGANGGMSLPDVARGVSTLIDRQTAIGREIGDLREANDATHDLLAAKVDRVSERLEAHAALPIHNRRKTDRTE